MNALLTSAVAGLTAAGAYALLGVCAVFTFRLVAVVNFTGAAIGTAGTFSMIGFISLGVPLWPAVVLGILVGTLAGALIGLVMTQWFSEATATTKAAVTAALLVGIVALGLRLTGGQSPQEFPTLFPGSAFRLAGVEVTVASVLTVVLALVFTLLADAFLNRTRTGLHLRALSERPMAAELLGVRVRILALLVWAVTGAFTTFALMIIAPQRSPDFMSLSLLVVPALAAALVGAFRSFPLALAGGLTIGIVEGMSSAIDGISQYRGILPFFVILAVLLWSQRGARWDEAR
jgi:branched-chain amino acid transport system permease protein